MNDAYIHIRINRNVCVAVIVSLLVHALMLLFLSRQNLFNQQQPEAAQQQTIDVRLNLRIPSKTGSPPPAEVQQPPAPAPRQKPKTKPASVTRPDSSRQILAAQTGAPPTLPPPRPPVAPKSDTLDPAQFPDMLSYLNAVREKRRLAGDNVDSSNGEAVARQTGPSEDEARMANIKRNLQPSGTNGIFRILSMDARTATFEFHGWRNEISYSHREVYEVEAGPNGDVARAIVRKMIEIIRRYYNGDFNWESQRLGRVVVLSARAQDNAGLEDFMLQEFFSSRGVPSQ